MSVYMAAATDIHHDSYRDSHGSDRDSNGSYKDSTRAHKGILMAPIGILYPISQTTDPVDQAFLSSQAVRKSYHQYFPRGSRYLTIKELGLKDHDYYGSWSLNPY